MAKNGTPRELLQALDLIRGTRGPKPELLDALELRHVERVRTIFEDRNIVAIGIAEKQTANKKTGELGLCFYVEKKIARSKVKSNRMISPVLSVADRTAVFTDVQQIGRVCPQINKRKLPLISGFSIGNDSDTGTLGAIVKKGSKFFLLSNSHVLARSGKGKAGDEIIYPGEADTSGKAQIVGTLTDVLPFKVGDDFLNSGRTQRSRRSTPNSSRSSIFPFEVRNLRSLSSIRLNMKILMRGRRRGILKVSLRMSISASFCPIQELERSDSSTKSSARGIQNLGTPVQSLSTKKAEKLSACISLGPVMGASSIRSPKW